MITASETVVTKSSTVESWRDPKASVDPERVAAQEFIAEQPWDEWQAEFFGAKDESGSYLYATVRDFARTRTDVVREQRWICWSIGHSPEPPMQLADEDWANWEPPVPWRGDWLAMRANQHSAGLSDAVADFAEGEDAGGEKRVLHHQVELIARLEGALQQLDVLFAGQVFDTDLSIAENDVRAFMYLSHLEKIFTLMFSVFERASGHMSKSGVAGNKQSGSASSDRSPVDADDPADKESQLDRGALILKSFKESFERVKRERKDKGLCRENKS
jgi:hypothetical protein